MGKRIYILLVVLVLAIGLAPLACQSTDPVSESAANAAPAEQDQQDSQKSSGTEESTPTLGQTSTTVDEPTPTAVDSSSAPTPVEPKLEIQLYGNTLDDFYNRVRDDETGLTPPLYNAAFCAALAQHDLGWTTWITEEREYQDKDNVYEPSTTTARRILDSAIAVAEVKEGDGPTEKIAKVLNFVHTYVTYQGDMDEAQRAPVETLCLGSGDCEDFTILAAALLEAVDVDCACATFSRSLFSDGHVMLLAHMDSIPGVSHWYDDLTSYGLQPGRWLLIEPQGTLSGQTSSWIEQWYSALLTVCEVNRPFEVNGYYFSPLSIEVGQTVTATIVFTGGTPGTYSLWIIRDIALSLDEIMAEYPIQHGGETTTAQVSYKPLDAGSYHMELRHYTTQVGINKLKSYQKLWSQPNDSSRLRVVLSS